jgi:hypothetical protein
LTGSTHASGSAEAATHLARAILAEGRFHQPPVPRPLHGALTAIGTAMRAPFDALDDAVVALGALFPGGVVGVWGVLAIIVLGSAWLLARRRSRTALAGGSGARAGGREVRERASELDRAAETAELSGRLADAVRLRFRAGLMRLEERGTIATAGSTPTSDVSRILSSSRFDGLARRFDEIAYGGSQPVAADVDAARLEWPLVLSGRDRP